MLISIVDSNLFKPLTWAGRFSCWLSNISNSIFFSCEHFSQKSLFLNFWLESMCPYKPIRACSPIVQGCGTVHRGTCCDKYMSVSPSQLALAACRWDTGMWPHRWWYATVYSSGNPCTVHSSAACRHGCCSSPGEQGEWGQRRCSWSDIDPAAPTGKTK